MELVSIQYLRGVAAMMVVVVHFWPQLQRMGYGGYWPHWMASGVDIFFLLSGFLMWVTTSGRKVTWASFYRKRAVRIVPLYWVLTSVTVAIMLFAPRLMQQTHFGLGHVIGSYLFVFTPSPMGGVDPVILVGWTLNYEMLFYVVFGASLAFGTRGRFAVVALVLGTLVAAGLFIPREVSVRSYYTAPIMLEFLFGMVVGWWYLRRKSQGSLPAGVALLVLGFGGMALSGELAPDLARVIGFGLPATAILVGAISLERSGRLPRVQWLHRLGDASYSIYLSHPMTLSALSQIWRRMGLHDYPGGWVGFCVVGGVLAVVVGVLVFELIEKPLLRLMQPRKAAVTAGMAPGAAVTPRPVTGP